MAHQAGRIMSFHATSAATFPAVQPSLGQVASTDTAYRSLIGVRAVRPSLRIRQRLPMSGRGRQVRVSHLLVLTSDLGGQWSSSTCVCHSAPTVEASTAPTKNAHGHDTRLTRLDPLGGLSSPYVSCAVMLDYAVSVRYNHGGGGGI